MSAMRGRTEELEGLIASLGDQTREELVASWQQTYGCPPPSGVRRELLIRSAAWHLQAKRLGGLSAETRRRLKIAVTQFEAQLKAKAASENQRAAGEGGSALMSATASDHAGGVISEGDPDEAAASTAGSTQDNGSNDSNQPACLAQRAATTVNDGGPVQRKSRRPLGPGARLIREWNGRSHVIDVLDNGFVFEGKVYRSLSAIARRITGTTWSGPRFFGLLS